MMSPAKFDQWGLFDQCKNVLVTNEIKTKLNDYYELLIQENQKYNLTRITDETDFYTKHIFDSLIFTNAFILKDQKLADLGSGAGFPGIVLKIFFPELQVVLIEANQKKVNFLNLVIETLGLQNIAVVSERAEDYSRAHQEEFDVVISRAVAYLDIILEIGVQMLRVGGVYILLKGPRAPEEIAKSGNLPHLLNLELTKHEVLNDKILGTRINLFYTKQGPTAAIYPRKYSVIKKNSGANH